MNAIGDKSLVILASLIYYAFALFLADQIISDSHQAVLAYNRVCRMAGPEAQADLHWQKLAERLSGGLLDGTRGHRLAASDLDRAARTARASASTNAWQLVLLSGLFMLPHLIGARNQPARLRVLTLQCSGVSLICLLIGLVAPVMSIVALKDLPLLGHVIFKYDSKSILATIATLWTNSRFISLLVILFSVMVPLVKVLLTLVSACRRESRIAAFIRTIGKWSMADVLVVAILLSTFSLGADASTDSWLEPGLYFFAGYAILSMLASHSLSLYLATEKTGPAPEASSTLST